MAKGSSSSSTSTTSLTETINADQRVAADNSALALGAGASLEINQQFSQDVKEAFIKLIDLAAGAGDLVQASTQQVKDASQAAINASQAAVETVSKQVTTTQAGGNTIFQQIFPYVAAVAVVAVVIILNKKKR